MEVVLQTVVYLGRFYKNDEKRDYRPKIHFSPEEGWMNDPNGMVYVDGVYHFFYQKYPYDTSWGPMHWGHATSRDLIHWEHQPIALYPDELGFIFREVLCMIRRILLSMVPMKIRQSLLFIPAITRTVWNSRVLHTAMIRAGILKSHI